MERMCIKAGMIICAVLAVTAAVLAGCAGTNTRTVPDPSGPSLLVDYQRSGGIAGTDDRLVIFDNGAGLVQNRITSREIELNQSDLDRIAVFFSAGQFTALEGNYTSGRGGADLMRYSISFQGKVVITEDTAIPESLEPVIAELNRILDAGLESRQTNMSFPRPTP